MAREWKKEYNIGVSIIDSQHQEMFAVMNELDDAISSKKSKMELDGILSSLIDWTKNHFDFEERIFNKLGFTEAKEHERHHKAFKQRLEDLRKKIEQEHEHLQKHLADYLEDWLTNHVYKQDRKFVSLFHKNGIK